MSIMEFVFASWGTISLAVLLFAVVGWFAGPWLDPEPWEPPLSVVEEAEAVLDDYGRFVDGVDRGWCE